MAHTAMSGDGTTAEDDPLQTAVWRLRSRACWVDAAALLTPATPQAALQRASLLVERCLYTETGWEDAEDALRTAEALAHTDDERGAAACERGYLAYAATLFQVRDRADEARAALGRAAALIAPGAKGRPLLDFRRGLIAENLTGSPQAARAAYRRAHAGATAHADPLLLSATWRHLAGLALREGELTEARHGFAESLRIREELGYLVGTAPALVSLADTETEPEASRLREEASRLFRLLGGVPTWLAHRLTPPETDAATA
ncbi:tetratricopeptide (TPR) repeat protein [Streptomyces albogriseolus]|uniref:Tetratricopeptide (TPR) repeat protein n=1 Tax=Streptomyces albogriseolus TaxID=1887 RepID=A0ACC6UUN6_STRAO